MKKKILLIEDNFEIRENTAEILALDNYDVEVAENGKVGVEKAISSKPDLIICDIMMPEMDGYTVLHMLHKNDLTRNIPFIFLTAKAERGDIRKGMEMGADDYLTKPFDDMELLSAIESRFRKLDLIKQEYDSNLNGLDGLVREVGGDAELKKLQENRQEKTYKKKAEIYAEGDYTHHLYYIQSGRVKTFKNNEDGKELITKLYGEGEFLGYQALLSDTAQQENATALETTVLCLIPKTEFNSLVFRNKQVAEKFIKLLAQDIQENEEHLVQMAYNSVRKRVATGLLKFAEKQGSSESNLKVSREDLSNVAGTSLETAIRTLSDFKSEGYIDIVGGKIQFLDKAGLENLRF